MGVATVRNNVIFNQLPAILKKRISLHFSLKTGFPWGTIANKISKGAFRDLYLNSFVNCMTSMFEIPGPSYKLNIWT